MRYVESCAYPPGQAIGGGNSAHCIDTEIDDNLGGRIYLDRLQAEQIADIVRGHSAAEHEKLELQLTDAVARVVELERELHLMRAAVEEAESLRNAIMYTLERGVVVNKQHLTIGLRHKPSQTRIDITKSLWPDPRGAV